MAKSGKSDSAGVKYPKGEDVCVTCFNRDKEPLFLITNKPNAKIFYIYEFVGNELIKLGKGSSPLELENKFNVAKRMGVE
jgi:hypothetical protein